MIVHSTHATSRKCREDLLSSTNAAPNYSHDAHSNPKNWHAKTHWGPSSPATIPSSGKRNLAVAVLVSKTSGGASWPQQCCEYRLLSCKQQGTKVEGGVIAAMWLHKVRKCVRFTRYQNKSTRKESFFFAWTIRACSEQFVRATHT